MKILTLDLEISPSLVAVWQLFNNHNIPITNITGESEILSWAAKWHGEDECHYSSLRIAGHTPAGRKKMLKEIHNMMDEADAIVTFNGNAFDLKVLNKEFLLNGLTAPAPYRSIDLYQAVRRKFRWTSNKLDYVCKRLGLGGKTNHPGISMWLSCMDKHSTNYKESWDSMEEYNVNDVFMTEALYDAIVGWIPNHPNHALYDGEVVCPKCGGKHLQSRGHAYTTAYKYRRYQCKDCGGWARSSKREPLDLEERLVQVA